MRLKIIRNLWILFLLIFVTKLKWSLTQRTEAPESPEAKEPFTEEQKANIMAEPDMANPETHLAEETTKDGSKFRFNKIEYELAQHSYKMVLLVYSN